MQECASDYAQAIVNQESSLNAYVGYIDCTNIQIYKPGGENLYRRSM